MKSKITLLALLLCFSMQSQDFDDEIEDYSRPSKGLDCQIPFSDCWCETRPNNPHCKDDAPAANLDLKWFEFTAIAGVFGIVFYKLKNKRDE